MMMVMIGADSFGSALLASGDMGATQHGLIAAGVLGVATKGGTANWRFVPGRHGRTARMTFVLNVEVVYLVFVVARDVAGHLGALELVCV
jgi:hypothetical protein